MEDDTGANETHRAKENNRGLEIKSHCHGYLFFFNEKQTMDKR